MCSSTSAPSPRVSVSTPALNCKDLVNTFSRKGTPPHNESFLNHTREDANRIRTKYFSTLGISAKTQSKKFIPLKLNLKPQRIIECPVHAIKSNRETQAIDVEIVHLSSFEDASYVHGGSHNRRSVSFDNSVRIHTIPARSHYPLEIRKNLWSTKNDLIRDVHRNVAEFAFEGWNWQLVVEDQDMIQGCNGELIHPAHFLHMRRLTVQHNFLAMRAAISSKQARLAKSYDDHPAVVCK